MQVGVPAEVQPGERRVAATPESVLALRRLGFTVAVERGAGDQAGFPDDAYAAAGAELVEAAAIWQGADIVLKVNAPQLNPRLGVHELDLLRQGQVLVGVLPREDELLGQIAARGATALALNGVPRITRAQKLDVLSSMANIAGYRAIVEAAHRFGSFFGPQMTAAGKVPPARVLVIGAGVAGLAAIGAARALGAEVRAFDTRPEVKEQVQSMGAAFLDLDFEEEGSGEGGYARVMSEAFIAAEMALFAQQCREVDVVVTTALIPGRRAPVLITEEMVLSMKPGSVIVDLAAENGGNCACTAPGQAVMAHGVHVIGYTDLPSRMAGVSSRFFASNLVHLLEDMGGGAGFRVDPEDEVVRGALFVHQGEVLPPPPRKPPSPTEIKPTASLAPPKAAPAPARAPAAPAPSKPAHGHGHSVVSGAPVATSGGRSGAVALAAAAGLTLIGVYAPSDFIQHFTVFILACFVGWQVVWSVTPALHTPLMSVTNAISGIILVGGLLQAGSGELDAAAVLGAVAILFATINIAGGFLVTQRMLQMFRK